MVRRATARRAIYTCHSLGLQDQMVRDYPYARVLKGRANYPTQTAPYPNITCADCTRTGTDTPCMWCPDPEACGYRTARAQALASPLVTTNTSYLLHETLSPQSGLRGRDLTIIDETDTLETTLTGVIEYTITPGMARQLQVTIPHPAHPTHPTPNGYATTATDSHSNQSHPHHGVKNASGNTHPDTYSCPAPSSQPNN